MNGLWTEDPSAPYIHQINNSYSSLVGRIMHPPKKDIHAFNPRTCEYVTVHDSRGFAHIIQLRILGWGDYLGLLRWVHTAQGRGAWWAAVYGVAQSRTRLK